MTNEDQEDRVDCIKIENGVIREKQLSKLNGTCSGRTSKPKQIKFVEPRGQPITHAPVDAPLCCNCQQLNLEFFDPSCPGCREILNDPSTTIAQIFACMRQWVPQTQRNVEGLIDQVMRRGAHVNDRDGLTDMTLLHFACKAGASGVGDAASAVRAVKFLLVQGADVNVRCKWTQMSSLHYAAYFDAACIVQLLLETSPEIDVNATCSEYNKGTALHIAASNLCLETVRVLMQCGAKLNLRDALGRTPKECIPNAEDFEPVPHVREAVEELRRLLTATESTYSPRNAIRASGLTEPVSGRALLRSMDLAYGSRVLVAGVKTGTLRFCGTTEFAVGLWIGVELDTPDGKNNGSINGVVYFKCLPNHGIFVPINKISKLGTPALCSRPSIRLSSAPIRHAKIDLSKVTSKIETGLLLSKSSPKTPEGETRSENHFKIGDRVLVSKQRKGTVRYYGTTKFSGGYWYGIELDLTEGKNDGSVQGVQYFVCSPSKGIFAQPSRVTRILTASDECLRVNGMLGRSGGDVLGTPPTNGNNLMTSSMVESKLTSNLKRNPYRMSFRIKTPNRSPRLIAARTETTPTQTTSPQANHSNGCWLTNGVNVLVNNELGVVRYIGPVDFAEGTWIGVDLRLPHGKNNGTVNGKQYFVCKQDHGLLVRPHKVSVHGINGSKLLEGSPPSVMNS